MPHNHSYLHLVSKCNCISTSSKSRGDDDTSWQWCHHTEWRTTDPTRQCPSSRPFQSVSKMVSFVAVNDQHNMARSSSRMRRSQILAHAFSRGQSLLNGMKKVIPIQIKTQQLPRDHHRQSWQRLSDRAVDGDRKQYPAKQPQAYCLQPHYLQNQTLFTVI